MPKIVDHEESRAELAEAAWRAIVELGIENATVRTVADYAGWSVGRLSHYFASKDDLFEYALRHIGGVMQRRFDERLRSTRGLAALRAILDEVAPTTRRAREEWLFWIAFWGRATRSAKLAAVQRRRHAAFRGALERCLEQAREDGELATFEPRTLGRVDVARELDERVARLRRS